MNDFVDNEINFDQLKKLNVGDGLARPENKIKTDKANLGPTIFMNLFEFG